MAKKTIRKSAPKSARAVQRKRQAGKKPLNMKRSLSAARVPREVSDAFRKVLQLAVFTELLDVTRQAAFRDKYVKEAPQIFDPMPIGKLSKLELGVFRAFGIPPTDDGLRALYRKGVEDGFLKPIDE